METNRITLIKGCIIFEEKRIFISEFYSLKMFNDINQAEEEGEEYLDNGGDSYLILESTNRKIIWDKGAKEQYLKALKNGNK